MERELVLTTKMYMEETALAQRAEAAEAKLAKVVEALEQMVEKWAPHCGLCVDYERDGGGRLVVNHCVCDPMHKNARAALAAAKGE